MHRSASNVSSARQSLPQELTSHIRPSRPQRQKSSAVHAAEPMAPPAKGAPGPMTGLKFLPEEARVRAQDRKANKQEKVCCLSLCMQTHDPNFRNRPSTY